MEGGKSGLHSQSRKSGPQHCKDFRPISLSSFLLKIMERLLSLQITQRLTPGNFSEAQHAYRKGRSVETALHEVVGSIEQALNHKEYALAAFLDVEGAFNNVNLASIHCSMVAVGLDPLITLWIDNMLSTRNINGSLGTSEVRKTATRGTPQGVLSPYCGTSC